MQKLHKWYYLACVYGLNFIEAKIPRDIFNTLGFDLKVKLVELRTIYHLQMINITMMTVWCM
jgi:adenylate cyclase class IV